MAIKPVDAETAPEVTLVAFTVPDETEVVEIEPKLPVFEMLSELLARSTKHPVAPVNPPCE